MGGNLGSEDFKYLSEEFSTEKLDMVKKKGVYPYEYFDSFKRFKEDILPDIDCSFSSLKDCGMFGKFSVLKLWDNTTLCI